ncbi:uncharacterized protein LOC143036139 [Oratosquilla oratoria]|uniref:uncharacterized protein LOC143036139 n=1 Tax=Oratosquilla oratoria TaxID=337810 RepID=UPI003F76BC5B
MAGKIQLEHDENLLKFQEATWFHNLIFNETKSWVSQFFDKIRPLVATDTFPLSPEALKAIDDLKEEIGKAVVHSIDETIPLVVETDAFHTAIAFFSRTLIPIECKHSAVEKEACANVESFYKPHQTPLIKATQPFEHLSLDFKGPLPSNSGNRYMVDEYSHFLFAFACQNMTTEPSRMSMRNCCLTLFIQLDLCSAQPPMLCYMRGSSCTSVDLPVAIHCQLGYQFLDLPYYDIIFTPANPQYAHVRFADGCKSTISVHDLAPIANISLYEWQKDLSVDPSIETGLVEILPVLTDN